MKYGAISIDPQTMGGTPVFTGTRSPIQSVFDNFEDGVSVEDFLIYYPTVSKDFVVQVLKSAKKQLQLKNY
jgi:uncharacterized protein (DUF433 family)